jgi:dephospho-CoA kinase
MNKTIIALGVEPASGKTTILKKVKANYTLTPFKYGKVYGECNLDNRLYFIGVFDGSTFEGTDRLSMAVQPDFIKLLNYIEGGVVIFEGDRLFNQSLFNLNYNFIKVVIKATDETLQQRHKRRRDSQSPFFIKSKRTKIKNILENNDCVVFNNNNEEEELIIINYIKDTIDGNIT